MKQRLLAGRTPIGALLDSLQSRPFHYSVDFDAGGHVSRLFFSHHRSMDHATVFASVLVLDWKYKTSRFKMPLLNIVGVTSTFCSFNASFAFLREEKEMDYVWAFAKHVSSPAVLVTDRELALMNAIREVYPNATNLLCVWHISKNVLVKCRQHFPSRNQDDKEEQWNDFLATWNMVVQSRTQEEFMRMCNEFKAKYKNSHSTAVSCIERTWMPYQDKFIRCFTDLHLHLGSHTSSRVEGIHSVMKQYANLSRCDLLSAFEKLCLQLETQFSEIQAKVEMEKTRIRHQDKLGLFQQLVGKVSRHAMDLMHTQLALMSAQLAFDPMPTCLGLFTKTYGLPCKHVMQGLQSEGRSIDLGTVHPHWHLAVASSPVGRPLNTPQSSSPEAEVMAAVGAKIESLSHLQQVVFLTRLNSLISEDIPEAQQPEITKVSKRDRPVGAKNKAIKRNKSEFEHVEMKLNGGKCSACDKSGHNTRTCKGNTKLSEKM